MQIFKVWGMWKKYALFVTLTLMYWNDTDLLLNNNILSALWKVLLDYTMWKRELKAF